VDLNFMFVPHTPCSGVPPIPCCATIARAVTSRPLVTNAAHAAAPEDFATTCYDTILSIQTRPLLPLRYRSTRVHAAQASVCWRAQSTVDSLFFIDVPTNPGPRSLCAWPVRRCRRRRSTHALNCSKLGPRAPQVTNPYPESRDPEFLDPGMSSLTIGLFRGSSVANRGSCTESLSAAQTGCLYTTAPPVSVRALRTAMPCVNTGVPFSFLDFGVFISR